MAHDIFGLDDNTKWLMNWGDRMVHKYGPPKSGYDWCRKLAYAIGEQGQDSPSDDALAMASNWEKNPPKT